MSRLPLSGVSGEPLRGLSVLPLRGRRVLVTRAKEQSSKLQERLEAAGAEVVAIPSIAIVPPDSYEALDASLRRIDSYDWLVLTSANAVRAIADRLQAMAVPVAALSRVPWSRLRIAAIGRATADAAMESGLTVALIPPTAIAESLADALALLVRGKRVLLIRAKVARDVLPDSLRAAGADVTIVDAYQTVIPVESVSALRIALQTPMYAVTFTSASSVHNLAALVEAAGVALPTATKKISIGPVTTRALREHEWDADGEASSADVEALVEAVVRAVGKSQIGR